MGLRVVSGSVGQARKLYDSLKHVAEIERRLRESLN